MASTILNNEHSTCSTIIPHPNLARWGCYETASTMSEDYLLTVLLSMVDSIDVCVDTGDYRQ